MIFLPEAYAVVKNACRRLCGTEIIVREHPLKWEMIPFDVQLVGGIALHQGKIAEMATGEGKTLVATMPVYLNALTGRGVHIVTVNDYLAARDSEWMGAVYRFLGLTVGCILRDQSPAVRREQYNCDITYGTNSEFGFDYLRDNGMAMRREEQVQRGHYFAIVDEVDSILIDEARTPLIISGPSVLVIDNKYDQFKTAVQSLVRAQEKLCARFLSEAEDLIKKLHPADGSNPAHPEQLESRIGLLLFRVKSGCPRSPDFLKVLENAENQRFMNQAELELHADQSKKSLYAEKEELFFAMDEKSHDADLTEKGRNFMRPQDPDAFVLPDLTVKFHEIDTGPESRPAQAAGIRRRKSRPSSNPRPATSIPSPNCSRLTVFTNWTFITWWKTARSSSWTNTPGGPCMAGAGATVCTRRSKPRRAWRSSARPRPWPPSPFKTISAFTKSWPA